MNLFYNLDPYLDTNYLKTLDDSICWGISKSEHRIATSNFSKYIQYPTTDIADVMNDLGSYISQDQIDTYNSFNSITEQYMYLSFIAKCSYLCPTVILREPKIADRYSDIANRDKTIWTNNSLFFPDLVNWIDDLPMDVGRVIIFLLYPFMQTLPHKDHPRRGDYSDDFIWCNPSGKKNFYVQDEDDVRHYIDSTTAWFDTSCYHGSEPNNYSTYSIRIDGKFNEDFKEQIFNEQGYPRDTN